MSETKWIAVGIGVLAFVFIYLGWSIWKKEKITLLHSYHYDKVSPGDKKDFITCHILSNPCKYWVCEKSKLT